MPITPMFIWVMLKFRRSTAADFQRLVKEKQVGQQRAQMNRGVEIVDHLRTDGALPQHKTHGCAGSRRVLAYHLDECGLITAAAVRGRHRGDERKPCLRAPEIAADVVARLLA